MKIKSGFTIMEIIVVIVIIGALAALALPSYRIQMLKIWPALFLTIRLIS